MTLSIVLRSTFATFLCALLITAVFVVEARAQAAIGHVERDSEVEIEQMSWVEVRDRLAQGATTILIPTGGTEQNGRHMALGKHNYIVRETARRIARQLGDALVAPVMAYVPQGPVSMKIGHMAYPGTISLPDDVFGKVLENVAYSFRLHGFKRIVFVGDSGGNQGAQKRVAKRLSNEWKDEGVQVLSADAYYGDNGGEAYLMAQGMTGEQIGGHAGVRDTSELMAVAPDLVDLDAAKPDSDGASGDARLASVELGEKLIAKKVAAAVAEIKAAASGEQRPVAKPGLIGWLFGLVTG